MHPDYFHRRSEIGSAERALPAMVLIGIGALFLLRNLNIVFFHDIFQWWPALLIAFGMVKLVDSEHQQSRFMGGMILLLGGLLLARNLGYLDYGMRSLWPLFLIGAGLWMLLDRTGHGPHSWSKNESTGTRLSEEAVFSGGKRNITTTDFQGGRVSAVFGGYELDFRNAGMVADSATLKVEVVFGGCEIRIPPNWSAETRGTGVFGAFTDESLQPNPALHHDIKKIIITGAAVFGGVVVKN
jgi:hypothetical protein